MASAPPNWSDSNLRGQSFRQQNLAGANFQGADVRGCDFSEANLTGANMAQTRIGGTPQSFVLGGLLMLGTSVFAFHMLSQLMFGILGLGRTDPNYGLRLALLSCFAIVGLGMGLIASGLWTSKLFVSVAVIEGALVGFFVGGLVSELSLNSAIMGGLSGAIALGLACLWARNRGVGVIVATLGVAMCNGMFLLAGVTGLQLFVTRHVFTTLGWLSVTCLYWWLTIRSIGLLYRELRQFGVTSFARANLSQVRWK